MRRRRKKQGNDGEPTVEASGDVPEGTVEASGEAPPAVGVDPKEKAAADYPRPGVAWGNIVRDSIRIKDPAGLARKLREELELGNDRTNYGAILIALDKSARNFDDAGRLHRAAKVEEGRFELEAGERLEVLRSTALAALMIEYKAKERRSPTAADIEDRCLENWPDEYRTIKGRIAELHGATQSLEVLMRAWGSRAADLRIMAEKAARAAT